MTVRGDLDGDGFLSAREILRMLYIDTLGRFWGDEFQPWADMSVQECTLAGITCVNGKIVKIDLTYANMCSNGEGRPGITRFCVGLPTELGLLSALHTLQLSRRQFLRGRIPTELGRLSKLRNLDLSRYVVLFLKLLVLPIDLSHFFFISCPTMWGTIPTELGMLGSLTSLMVSHSCLSLDRLSWQSAQSNLVIAVSFGIFWEDSFG
jgi:hypothetical protein